MTLSEWSQETGVRFLVEPTGFSVRIDRCKPGVAPYALSDVAVAHPNDGGFFYLVARDRNPNEPVSIDDPHGIARHGIEDVDANEDGIAYLGTLRNVTAWLLSHGWEIEASSSIQAWNDIRDSSGNRVGQIDDSRDGLVLASMSRTAMESIGLRMWDED